MSKLDDFRLEIDKIDRDICSLICKRFILADEIIKAKGNKFPFDPKREKKLIKKIINHGLNATIVERIWRQIISSNLARQKKLKIGIVDNKLSLAAVEIYFGPYFNNFFFKNEKDLLLSLRNNDIDIGFVEKNQTYVEINKYNVIHVADFPYSGNFYNKKFCVLINQRN